MVVAVSIIPEAWLVRRIGGQHVDVVTLVAPGENPHTYQPTDAQVSRVMTSAVYFRMGVPFEKGPWFQALQNSRALKIVDLRDGIKLREIKADDHDHAGHAHGSCCSDDGRDPHVWLTPQLLKTEAATIARTLGHLDAVHQETYQANLKALSEELDELDRKIRDRLKGIQHRSFFVFHPAWEYFADEYGLHEVAIEVEGKEPSDRELTELQRLARAEKAAVVFVQPQISGRAAKAVADATGARVETADPMAEDLPAQLLRLADALVAADRR
jgi:zinc transport system substrate-binding protein